MKEEVIMNPRIVKLYKTRFPVLSNHQCDKCEKDVRFKKMWKVSYVVYDNPHGSLIKSSYLCLECAENYEDAYDYYNKIV